MLMAGAFQWVTPSFLNSSAILNLPVHSSPASQVSPVATSIFEPFIAQPSLTIIVATAAGDGERESVPAFLHNPWSLDDCSLEILYFVAMHPAHVQPLRKLSRSEMRSSSRSSSRSIPPTPPSLM